MTAHVTDPTLWAVTAMLAFVVTTSTMWLGWSVSPRIVEQLGSQFVVLLGIGLYYQVSGRSEALARMGYASALFLALANLGQATTYILGTVGAPFQDAALRAADAALGFSWTSWTAWVNQHPLLGRLFWVSYRSDLTEAALLVMLLSLRSLEQVTAFLRAVALSLGVALIGLELMPALGMIPDAPSIPVRLGLREGTYHSLSILGTPGIISMPSFHAVMSVLVVVACWPFRSLRWPLLAWNVVMLVATISEGGHYLVDVLAGVMLAIVAARVAGMPALRRSAVTH